MPAATGAPRLTDILAVLDDLYDPAWAEPWDAVGLVCGDPEAEIRRVLLAVDPAAAVAEEALARGADLVVTHHPLFLEGVHGVPATTAKGRLLSHLIRHGIALHVAHTNADNARPGVSDALGAALGLTGLRPLAPAPAEPLDKIVTFVPHADVAKVIDALAGAGAGEVGDYRRCAFTVTGEGTFTPQPGARPAIGSVGGIADVPETRLEMVLPRARRGAVVAALRRAHPYEEPAFDVLELALPPGERGTGRIGRLERPESLASFTSRVAAALPATAMGVRVAGDPGLPVETVAVCGGSGGGLLDVVRAAGVDVYVTADLRHHPVAEAMAEGQPALVDAAHWATEWPWLADAADRLARALAVRGTTVETRVSRIVTDPWTAHVPQRAPTASTSGSTS